MAASMAGEYDMPLTVAEGENGSLIITLPMGDPAITYTLTKEHAESLGLDMDRYGE